MSEPLAQFPAAVWDASSAARSNDRTINREPEYEDWDQAVAEILAIESYLLNKSGGVLQFVNDNAGALAEGVTVYVKSNGHIDKANSVSAAAATLIGIVDSATGIGIGATGGVRIDGVKTFSSTANVDAAYGTTGGFTPGAQYYVSDATAGKGVGTAPSTSTHLVWQVGIALTATMLRIFPQYIKTN